MCNEPDEERVNKRSPVSVRKTDEDFVSKSCVETSLPSNYDEMSNKLTTDWVILGRKTTKLLQKKPYFPRVGSFSLKEC